MKEEWTEEQIIALFGLGSEEEEISDPDVVYSGRLIEVGREDRKKSQHKKRNNIPKVSLRSIFPLIPSKAIFLKSKDYIINNRFLKTYNPSILNF